jgi:hypothetical protein
MQFTDYIDKSILVLIPRFHERKYLKVMLRGVEAGGIWIESQDIINQFLTGVGLSSAPKTLGFFVPYASIAVAVTAIDKMALNETAFDL